MSEDNLKKTIKSIEDSASLDNISKALRMTKYIMQNAPQKATQQQASVLGKDLQAMASKGKLNHMKIQSDIASLFMFA